MKRFAHTSHFTHTKQKNVGEFWQDYKHFLNLRIRASSHIAQSCYIFKYGTRHKASRHTCLLWRHNWNRLDNNYVRCWTTKLYIVIIELSTGRQTIFTVHPICTSHIQCLSQYAQNCPFLAASPIYSPLSRVAQSCYSVIGDKPFLWSKPKFDPP